MGRNSYLGGHQVVGPFDWRTAGKKPRRARSHPHAEEIERWPIDLSKPIDANFAKVINAMAFYITQTADFNAWVLDPESVGGWESPTSGGSLTDLEAAEKFLSYWYSVQNAGPK
jgi:hypothetical protein